jgi:Xaa-Pro dipeptidase
MEIYKARLEKVWDWMAKEGISLVMLEDSESRRDNNIRWLTGHPNDALLFLTVDRKALLAAWDINLAELSVRPPVIIAAYNDFDRNPRKAALAIIKKLNVPTGSKIEIPAVTPYPVFLDYVGDLTNFDVLCREKGAGGIIRKFRAVKDEDEVNITRKAAQITNELIELLKKNVRNGKIKTEADAALTIEVECRKRGCEGTSFGTLAAGMGRSFAIHAFPGWTCAPFAEKGLSILDFGVNLDGYSTDVTLTFARDLDSKQKIIVDLVEKAYEKALSLSHNGTPARDIAAAVDKIFSKSKKSMPHGLGHGIGLDAHEYPILRNSNENEWVLEPGMIFTIEPGLYDQGIGGCRLENDVLITKTGYDVLTNSHIIYL